MNKELEYKYDIFKEITNICIGNSISALANMANISIDVSPPELYIVDTKNIGEVLSKMKNLEERAIGIVMKFAGRIEPTFLLILSTSFMKSITRKNKLDVDEVIRYGNLLSTYYMLSLKNFLGIFLVLEKQDYTFDVTIGEIFENVLLYELEQKGRVLLAIVKTNVKDIPFENYFVLFVSNKDFEELINHAKRQFEV